ncbi:hypothetical protein [Chryseobacterium wanjuense]
MERSFGFSDHVTKVPNTTDITFPIASISKNLYGNSYSAAQGKGLAENNRSCYEVPVRVSLPRNKDQTFAFAYLRAFSLTMPF